MKNLKWRIWVKPENKFYYIDVDTLLYETFSKWEKEDLEIQQFTGLLDKEGKEIYEGDILDSEDNLWFDKYEVKIPDIYELNGKHKELYLGDIDFREIEVIGSIYENKDLIKL